MEAECANIKVKSLIHGVISSLWFVLEKKDTDSFQCRSETDVKLNQGQKEEL